MNKIKILEIVPNMQQGGLENLIMNIIRNLDMQKYEIHFLYHYTGNYYFDEEIKKIGCTIHKCSFRDDKNIFKYIKFLKKFFKENHFDVVHSHMLSTSRLTLKYAKQNGCKILINHSHNSKTEQTLKGVIKRFMILNASKYANEFLACSEDAGKFAYGNRNFIIVKNGIDLKKFSFSAENRKKIREELNIGERDVVFGNVGRLNIQKNQSFLIESFAKIKNNNAKLMIIGFGELKEEILSKISEMNISEKIIMLENVKSECYYSAMDCFVLPSIFEGFPLTAVEAQANGCPCVFSNKITKNVKLNNNVKFLDIDKDDEWIQFFNDFDMKREKCYSEKLLDYDIEKLKNVIEKIYSKGTYDEN